MAIAQLLSMNREMEVHMCGGFVRARDHAVVGEAAVDFVKQFRFDTVIIGVAGIEPDGSMRDFDYREVKVTEKKRFGAGDGAIGHCLRHRLLGGLQSSLARNFSLRAGSPPLGQCQVAGA